jgi:hypothetical protein
MDLKLKNCSDIDDEQRKSSARLPQKICPVASNTKSKRMKIMYTTG